MHVWITASHDRFASGYTANSPYGPPTPRYRPILPNLQAASATQASAHSAAHSGGFTAHPSAPPHTITSPAHHFGTSNNQQLTSFTHASPQSPFSPLRPHFGLQPVGNPYQTPFQQSPPRAGEANPHGLSTSSIAAGQPTPQVPYRERNAAAVGKCCSLIMS